MRLSSGALRWRQVVRKHHLPPNAGVSRAAGDRRNEEA
jgi:hypothetical protein